MKILSVLLLCLCSAPLAAETAADFALHDGDRVVFYGDSITQHGGYAQFVEQYARSRFPTWNLHFFNAGVGGDSVRGGGAGPISTRLERDVLRLKPTVVTVMLGMNDGHYRPRDPATLVAFTDGYRAIVAQLRAALPDARLYLILPSPFDDFSRPPDFAGGYDTVLRQLGGVAATIAGEQRAEVVDFGRSLAHGIARVEAANHDLARQLLPDRVHPNPAAHLVLGATLLRAWHAPALVARVEIDAQTVTVTHSANTQVNELGGADGHLRWSQLDRSLPLPLSYEDADTDLAQRAGADLESLDQQPLVVTGLPSAGYELTIDDRTFGPFTAEALAAGVNLARYNTPMRWQAYPMRWGAEGGHQRQIVARSAYASGNPQLIAAADILSTDEEQEQAVRSRPALPQPRKFSLRRLP